MADGKDHERIWLEPGEPKSSEGRMWCENNAWSHRGEHGQATEYVRADLIGNLLRDTAKVPPWQSPGLSEWSIVGMNHYSVNGRKWLFVAMAMYDHCIKAEGPDGPLIWSELEQKAKIAWEKGG
jgi:hypothetical protein